MKRAILSREVKKSTFGSPHRCGFSNQCLWRRRKGMNRFICSVCLSMVLFFAVCGTSHALSVTLMKKPSIIPENAIAFTPPSIVLTFGSNLVAIHDKGLYVQGTLLTHRDVPLSQLFLIRDHRALSKRTEYETIYLYGPFQLAYVPKPSLLSKVKHVAMQPITAGMVVTLPGNVGRTEASVSVEQVLAKLDMTRYGDYLFRLAGDPDLPNRYACSPHAATAHSTIVKAFQEMNLNQLITDQKFSIPVGGCAWSCSELYGFNVIGIKTGTTRPDDYYVVGAHYDSMNDKTTPCNTARGACDNASGVAGVLELAKAFSEFTTDASIVFVAFGGEEIDLLGSRQYVQDLVEKKMDGNIKAFVVLDMISYYKNSKKIYIEGSNKTLQQKAATDKLVNDTSTYTWLQCDYAYDFYSKGKGNSDHVPFLEKGIPGALLIQWESDSSAYKYLHTEGDLIQYQNLPFAIEILKVAAATLTQAGVNTPH